MDLCEVSKGSKEKDEFICGVVEGFYGRPWTADQRRHLFRQLKKLGMSTYLYAPKDDIKHRAEWRILYTPEEAAVLGSLISSANDNGITFVYALSPGIDIVYSNGREIRKILDKISQVRSLGCSSFALLFDDIEQSMNELDRKKFSTFVQAQISVTNEIFESLNCPKLFMFCPTEYCESRAAPSLEESEYLTTLGLKLNPDIQILWTGPRVVSRSITKEHIQRVSKVFRRKPLIWDNLHANDYDIKRIFLGPFCGRSTCLKNEISGLLLNPNTKYEANFVPFFTLGEWCQSDSDSPRVENDHNVTLESTPEEVLRAVEERHKPLKLYHPLTSLRRGLNEWLISLTHVPGPHVPPISEIETKTTIPIISDSSIPKTDSSIPPPTIRTCEGNEMLPDVPPPPIYTTSAIGGATTVTVQALPLMESIIGAVDEQSNLPQTLNSLTADYNNMEVSESETPILPASALDKQQQMDTMSSTSSNKDKEEIRRNSLSEPGDYPMDEDEMCKIDFDSLALFVDIFYLPFEHGQRGVQLLKEFFWLYENAHLNGATKDGENDEWLRRYNGFLEVTSKLLNIYAFMVGDSPNKSFVHEIFPYLYEAQAIVSIVNALLHWMRDGNYISNTCNIRHTKTDSDDRWSMASDMEPWVIGGGLLPELQKCIVTTSNIADLFTIKPGSAIPLSAHCYVIELADLANLDKSYLYESFSSLDEKRALSFIQKYINIGDLFYDRTYLPLLKFGSPRHNFIAERHNEEESITSIVMGILNVQAMINECRTSFYPELKEQYSKMIADRNIGNKEELVQILHDYIDRSPLLLVTDNILRQYPSMIELRSKEYVNDAVSIRRLLHCVTASLALNGSTGFFLMVEKSEHQRSQLFQKIGLELICDLDQSNMTIMGHSL